MRNAIEPALGWLEDVSGWDDVVDQLHGLDLSNESIPQFRFDLSLDEAADALIFLMMNKDKWVDGFKRRNWSGAKTALQNDINLELVKRLLGAMNWSTLIGPLREASKFSFEVDYF